MSDSRCGYDTDNRYGGYCRWRDEVVPELQAKAEKAEAERDEARVWLGVRDQSIADQNETIQRLGRQRDEARTSTLRIEAECDRLRAEVERLKEESARCPAAPGVRDELQALRAENQQLLDKIRSLKGQCQTGLEREERLREALGDIDRNYDHEHHSHGSVREGQCDGPGRCRCCTAHAALGEP